MSNPTFEHSLTKPPSTSASFAELSDIRSAITGANATLATHVSELATATSELQTAITDSDAATAAWILDGSPGSGATFDTKGAALAGLANKQATFDSATLNVATDRALLGDYFDAAADRAGLLSQELMLGSIQYQAWTFEERVAHAISIAIRAAFEIVRN